MKTAPTNKKIREIIQLVREGRIVPRPEFQRRLVWKAEDKNHFLDSVLNGYPFPEIYLADGEVDLESGEGTQLLVDGLQRVNTLVQYFNDDPELKLSSVSAYKNLSDEEKSRFLQYDMAVRDLGTLSTESLVEVFRRINATKYSLTDIEVSNAVYRGELKDASEKLSIHNFFSDHRVFSALDYRRMGDLRFGLLLIVTVLGGYGNRDDTFEEFLQRYNDEFPHRQKIDKGFQLVFDFVEECGFLKKSRVWRKADLFTLVIELYIAINDEKLKLNPTNAVYNIQSFYDEIETGVINEENLAGIYYKAAIQASNDRLNRVRRALIIGGIIREIDRPTIMANLVAMGLA